MPPRNSRWWLLDKQSVNNNFRVRCKVSALHGVEGSPVGAVKTWIPLRTTRGGGQFRFFAAWMRSLKDSVSVRLLDEAVIFDRTEDRPHLFGVGERRLAKGVLEVLVTAK